MFSGRLIQLTAGACLSIALVTALPAFLLWLDFSSFEKDQVRSLLAPRQTLITVLLGCAALLPVLFFGTYFYRHLRTMRKLNVQMREAVEGRTEELELDEEVPPEARDLANTASEMLQRSMQRQDELNSNLASATSISSRDRTRFTAMIGELAQGVMVCDVNGNLLLFNSRARDLLGEESNRVDLGGSIFQLFDQDGRVPTAQRVDQSAGPRCAPPLRTPRTPELPTVRSARADLAARTDPRKRPAHRDQSTPRP